MAELILAGILFLATHALPAVKPLRRRLTAVIGEPAYMGLYSLITLGVLAWLITAYAAAPSITVWTAGAWSRWLAVLVMPIACILLVAGMTSRNPFSLGLGGRGFNPDKPGIVAVTRHPVIWALVLWAAVHIPPNGDVASLILFGVFVVASLAGPPSLDAKRRARMGPRGWDSMARATSNLPFRALLTGRASWRAAWPGVWRVGGGLVLYWGLLQAHERVIGVSPMMF